MNTNPYQARIARTERKQNALQPARDAMDEALTACRECLQNDDPAMRLRAAHAISQLAGAYVKLYEAIEMESRLAAIESQLDAGKAARN